MSMHGSAMMYVTNSPPENDLGECYPDPTRRGAVFRRTAPPG
jgi:hypothetical protein